MAQPLQGAFRESTNQDPRFRSLQLGVNTFFHHHRAGTLISSRTVPQGWFNDVPQGVRVGQWSYTSMLGREDIRQLQFRNRSSWLRSADSPELFAEERFEPARRRLWSRVSKLPVREGGDVRIARMLGHGGNGIVYLFEVWDGKVIEPKKVVLKASIRPEVDMRKEKGHTLVSLTQHLAL